MDIITIGLVAMGCAGLGVTSAGFFGVREGIIWLRDKAEAKMVQQQLGVEESLNLALDDVMAEKIYIYSTPVTSKRHNIHCPSCGRFSKRVMGLDNVVECKAHGIQVRWKDIPVDWAAIPVAEGVTLNTGPITLPTPLPLFSAPTPLDDAPIDHREMIQLIPQAA